MHTTGRSFADFAESLSFVKSENSTSNKHSPVGLKNKSADEKRSLIPFVSWGLASATPSPSSSSSTLSPFPSANPSMIGAPTISSSPSTFSSLAHYAKQGFSSARNSAALAASRTQERVEEAGSSVSRYLYFSLSCLVGTFLIFLAFLFLPFVVFTPQKFALLFTLGSLFLINGLGLLKGYRPLFYHLIERDRITFSGGYAFSLVATLYVTLGLRSYVLTLIFAALQLAFLIFLLISYLAGSTRVLLFIQGVGTSFFKKVFGGGGEVLPL